MLALFWQVTAAMHPEMQLLVRTLWAVWVVLLCRIIKYFSHFSRYPQDLKYLFLIPLFGYFHSCIIKTYAMATMHVTTWGSREGADANDNYRMIRLPVYDTDASGMPSSASVNDPHSLESANYGKLSTELASGFRIYVPSTIDDYFADETTPILPKYDGPEYGATEEDTPEQTVPDEDAPEYESPDEEGPGYHSRL